MRRREGPHCFAQKRPRTIVSELQSVVGVETSTNKLSRDFWYRSIFDFCNSICQNRTLPLDRRESPVADNPPLFGAPFRIKRRTPVGSEHAGFHPSSSVGDSPLPVILGHCPE